MSDYDNNTTVTEEDTDTMSSAARLGNIIVAPVEALEAIRHKPNVLLPMIILPLFSLLYYLLFWESYEIQMIQLLEDQFQSMGMTLTRDMLEMQLKIIRWTTPLSSTIGIYIGALIAALMYFAVGRIMKKEVAYKQTLSMILHISIVANLLWVVHMAATMIFGESNIMAPITSAASLLPAELQGTIWAGVLMNVEIINIWYLCLLYLGLVIVCRYSKKAAGITIGVTVFINILMTAGSYMASGMGGF